VNPYLAAAGVGLLAGTHTATWGMYKDAPHEGFGWRRYVRSIVVSTLAAPFVAWLFVLDPRRAPGFVVLFGVTYAFERALVEFYKTFLREEDQSKYTIPMQFHVNGRVVKKRSLRLLVGLGYAAAALLFAWGAFTLDRALGFLPAWLRLGLAGSVGGWLSAFGGAQKDAPIEGFHTFKFFRSPALAMSYGILLSLFTHNVLVVGLGALGYTIATIETYKTFFFPHRPRGKFQGKPIQFPELLAFRQRFVPVYAAIWLVLLTQVGLAVAGRVSGTPAVEGQVGEAGGHAGARLV
jgi:hypothetical protein